MKYDISQEEKLKPSTQHIMLTKNKIQTMIFLDFI